MDPEDMFDFMQPGMAMGAIPIPPSMAAAMSAASMASLSPSMAAAYSAAMKKNKKKRSSVQITKVDGDNDDGNKKAGKKKAAPEPLPPVPVPDPVVWDRLIRDLPRCASSEGIRESSYFSNRPAPPDGRDGGRRPASGGMGVGGGGASQRSTCLRKLLQELVTLPENLPTNPAIWVRFDEETPQYLRALVTAPLGTPYALGLFCFDVYVPDSYPRTPPRVQLLTTGGGTVRFSPNLYRDGKVCLSLLNTWQGPRWNPRQSTLLQVLLSLQGLILGVEHPYYLEPGHGGWEGKVKQGTFAAPKGKDKNGKATAAAGSDNVNKAITDAVPYRVQQYEDKIRMGTARFAHLELVQHVLKEQRQQQQKQQPKDDQQQQNRQRSRPKRRHYLEPFVEIMAAHFDHSRDSINACVAGWASRVQATQRRQLRAVAEQLKEELAKFPSSNRKEPLAAATPPSGEEEKEKNSATTKASSSDDVVSEKRCRLEQAVAQKDYLTAGILQSELAHLEGMSAIDSKIASKRKAMEDAAARKDYIAAGRLQRSLNGLEQNRQLLHDLERRMYRAAADRDFCKAGRFQEQYHVLTQAAGEDESDERSSSEEEGMTLAAAVGGAGAKGPPMVMSYSYGGGGGPPFYDDDEDVFGDY